MSRAVIAFGLRSWVSAIVEIASPASKLVHSRASSSALHATPGLDCRSLGGLVIRVCPDHTNPASHGQTADDRLAIPHMPAAE